MRDRGRNCVNVIAKEFMFALLPLNSQKVPHTLRSDLYP